MVLFNDDVVEVIVAYENDELTTAETVALFSELISTGAVWSLQGTYGRTAARFIDGGVITPEGVITDLGREMLAEDD